MTRKTLLLLSLTIAWLGRSYGQDDRLNAFRFDPISKTNQSILSSTLPESYAYDLYAPLHFGKRGIFHSGLICTDPKLNAFVDRVTNKVMQGSGVPRESIKVFILNSVVVNAQALPDGTIFINLGLLSIIENEAQLAFILAHEIAHITQEHGIKAMQKRVGLDESPTMASRGRTFKMLANSRESESESDARGLEMMRLSPYDARQADEALGLLQDSLLFSFTDSLDLAFLGIKDTLKPGDLRALEDEAEDYDLEVFEREYDDKYYTHPALDKRIIAVDELLRLSEYNPAGKKLNLGPAKEVAEIRNRSYALLIDEQFAASNFGVCLYICLQIKEKFGATDEINTMIGKSLYWLAYYKEIENLDKVLSRKGFLNTPAYLRFFYNLREADLGELKKSSHRILKEAAERSKADEPYFYYGLASSDFLGKELGRVVFLKYQALFPSGKYAALVKKRLAN